MNLQTGLDHSAPGSVGWIHGVRPRVQGTLISREASPVIAATRSLDAAAQRHPVSLTHSETMPPLRLPASSASQAGVLARSRAPVWQCVWLAPKPRRGSASGSLPCSSVGVSCGRSASSAHRQRQPRKEIRRAEHLLARSHAPAWECRADAPRPEAQSNAHRRERSANPGICSNTPTDLRMQAYDCAPTRISPCAASSPASRSASLSSSSHTTSYSLSIAPQTSLT